MSRYCKNKNLLIQKLKTNLLVMEICRCSVDMLVADCVECKCSSSFYTVSSRLKLTEVEICQSLVKTGQ